MWYREHEVVLRCSTHSGSLASKKQDLTSHERKWPMTTLTTCQALRYALIPGLSEEFEKVASEQGPFADPRSVIKIQSTSPLSHARSMLLVSITAIAMGIIGMIVTGYHYKFVSMTMGACLLTVGAVYMLYEATAKIQTVWNSTLSA
jgi:hypothetical protein